MIGSAARLPRRNLRRSLIGILIGACCAWGHVCEAAGSSCGKDAGPWISVKFVGGIWDAGLPESVLTDLDAGLRRRGLSACLAPNAPEHAPLAAIRLALDSGESVSVTVDIRDALTNKRVMRQLDLAPIPLDGRALALALAAEELTWASWAELALTEHPRSRKTPRPVVTELHRRLGPPRARSSRLGAGLGLEQYTGGLTLVGGDVIYGPRMGERFRVEFGLGLRQGLETAAPDGRIGATAMGLEAGLQAILLSAKHLELALTGGGRTSYVRFNGRAAPKVQAGSLSGLALFARAGVQATLFIADALWVGVGIAGGVPLRAVVATDQGEDIVGMSGLEGAGHVRMGVSL